MLPIKNLLRDFIDDTVGTFSSVEYYRTIPQRSSWGTALWFGAATTLISWIVVGYSAVIERPTLLAWYDAVVSETATHFPSELEIVWNGQNLLTNQQVPIPIFFPQGIDVQRWGLPERFGYLLPSVVPAEKVAEQLPTSAWLVATPTTLYIQNGQGGWSQAEWNQLLQTVPQTTITKSSVQEQLLALKPAMESAVTFVLGLGLLLLPFMLGGYYALTALFDGLLAFLMSMLYSGRLTFGQIYKISLHLSLVAGVVSTLGTWLYGPSSLPLFGITYWLLFSYAAFHNRKSWFPTRAR